MPNPYSVNLGLMDEIGCKGVGGRIEEGNFIFLNSNLLSHYKKIFIVKICMVLGQSRQFILYSNACSNMISNNMM